MGSLDCKNDNRKKLTEVFYGFLGVLVGALIPLAKEEFHRYRSRKERALYLAARVICILDEYIDKCEEVVQDNGGADGYPAVDLLAAPDFPADIDWKTIDSKLMFRILGFSNKVHAKNWLIYYAPYLPDDAEVYAVRQTSYAELGLQAIEIIEDLKKLFNLPEAIRPYDETKENFARKLEQFAKYKNDSDKDTPF